MPFDPYTMLALASMGGGGGGESGSGGGLGGPLALLGGGAIGSALGGIIGSRDRNRAARKSRDFYERRTGEAGTRLGSAFFGPEAFQNFAQSGFYGDPDFMGEGSAFNQAIGGPIFSQLQDLARFTGAGGTGIIRDYDAGTQRLGDAGRSAIGQAGQAFDAAQMGALDPFMADAGRIRGLAAGQEGIAREFGRGAERLIDDDASRALRAANAASDARYAASGLGGSSLTAQSAAGNARDVGREATRAKVGVRQATTDRELAARSGRIGTEGALANTAAGIRTGFGGQKAGTIASMLESGLGRGFAREGGRTALQSSNLDRHLAFKQLPISTALQFLSSPAFNPMLGQNTSQFYPGASGAGSALGSLGNASALMGAFGLQRGGFG